MVLVYGQGRGQGLRSQVSGLRSQVLFIRAYFSGLQSITVYVGSTVYDLRSMVYGVTVYGGLRPYVIGL